MSCLICKKEYQDHSETERSECLTKYIEQRKQKDPGGCPADCGHTDEEHQVFDIGVRAGELGMDSEDYPLWYDDNLIETWQIGRSVGAANRKD